MVKLTGLKKIKTAVFISGTGSNLKNLISFSKIKISPISISLVISDNSSAKGLNFARQFKIKKKFFNFKNDKFIDEKILRFLKIEKIKFICLAGFMKILSKNFIKKFNGKIINIHPSLLPKYGGKGMYGDKVHKAVLQSKEKQSGISIHFVNQNYDEGELILQKRCSVSKNETLETLNAKIYQLEQEYFPITIEEVLKKQNT